MSKNTIDCPKCGTKIEIDDSIIALRVKEQIMKESKANAEKEWKIKEELILKEKDEELNALKNQNDEFRKKELELRKEKNAFELKSKNFDLELQRKLDEGKKLIREETAQELQEKNRWNNAQKDRIITNLSKKIEEMDRQAKQGSQQSQGEVVEVELEKVLKEAFPFDKIRPVNKGVKGGDVIQEVVSQTNKPCGKIYWESKNVKGWSTGWIPKLKNDCRNEKADIAVLITTTLPENVKNFDKLDGVWVSKFEFVLGLANALRGNLIELTRTKTAVANKNGVTEILYEYITGNEFRQRVQAIAEAWKSLQDGLADEKRAYDRIWAKREKELTKVVSHTWGMYGDLEAMIGKSFVPVETLGLMAKSEDTDIQNEIDENNTSQPKKESKQANLL